MNWREREKDGIIDLGTMNGWSKETSALYEYLRQYKVEGTDSGFNLGRCYNAYEWKANIHGEEVSVRYKIDSGD